MDEITKGKYFDLATLGFEKLDAVELVETDSGFHRKNIRDCEFRYHMKDIDYQACVMDNGDVWFTSFVKGDHENFKSHLITKKIIKVVIEQTEDEILVKIEAEDNKFYLLRGYKIEYPDTIITRNQLATVINHYDESIWSQDLTDIIARNNIYVPKRKNVHRKGKEILSDPIEDENEIKDLIEHTDEWENVHECVDPDNTDIDMVFFTYNNNLYIAYFEENPYIEGDLDGQFLMDSLFDVDSKYKDLMKALDDYDKEVKKYDKELEDQERRNEEGKDDKTSEA